MARVRARPFTASSRRGRVRTRGLKGLERAREHHCQVLMASLDYAVLGVIRCSVLWGLSARAGARGGIDRRMDARFLPRICAQASLAGAPCPRAPPTPELHMLTAFMCVFIAALVVPTLSGLFAVKVRESSEYSAGWTACWVHPWLGALAARRACLCTSSRPDGRPATGILAQFVQRGAHGPDGTGDSALAAAVVGHAPALSLRPENR